MNTRQCRPALLASIIGLLVLVLPAVGDAQNRPLKILLTNDDGFDSSGLNVMRVALVAAGHQVTVVAPATNVSASSMSMTSGVVKMERKGDAVWAVEADAAPTRQVDGRAMTVTIERDTTRRRSCSGSSRPAPR